MKRIVLVLLVITLAGVIVAAGCAGTTPGPAPSSAATGATPPSTPIATTAVAVQTTTATAGAVIIDERINLQSGYPTTWKEYNFENYGYVYFYPGDSFKISIDSDKPVNVLVIDKGDELKFPAVIPQWNTALKKNQWDYSPVVPVFTQSNVLRQDMTFTIKDKATYYLIIDPRFSSEQVWQGSKHEEVHVDVKVTKL
jgi:hypothetical protein